MAAGGLLLSSDPNSVAKILYKIKEGMKQMQKAQKRNFECIILFKAHCVGLSAGYSLCIMN